ncbi:SusC/RagA family TonB-linked outer membrane protein [Hymenobacter sediminis]|uniref:SusC/RagA family TonB-linked outer membrane protein n=1 Tax=Hymenobacter sediminis TaxID=2218621 RepID=UPI000DA68651|nr:SusC/RagA family TonB-linked outer membrane protein [Hymenobacter sediminis]RPD50282.1 SusC/RagA family TonB-linked outer membrane protein [Hymenobacter sediminis]
MKRLLPIALPLLAIAATDAVAQTRSISGRVTDRTTGEGLPGVTVLLKGTTNGISTNSDGTFTLTVPSTDGTLVFSSIGFITVERPIGTDPQINVGLASDSKQLSEVVVTALGIERDTRTLGYATQEIKADQIAQKSEPNVLSALQGKVSGVNITTASGLPGASSNINIRGITSFSGSNQPLFVVDGIPISNNLETAAAGAVGSYGSLGAPQTANRALDIDPETVESINILKGPAAAALYGSRASSGAIIITTKGGRGAANKKLEVTATSGLTFQNVYGTAELQNDYGQGTGFRNLRTTGNDNSGSASSWGPRFGTTPTIFNGLLDANGNPLPYQLYKDNIKDFYRTGRILTNGINIQGGNPDQNVSLNINNTDQKGITETSYLKRTNVQLAGNVKLINKLKAGGSVNFIQTNQQGPLQGNSGSVFGALANVPRSYDLQNNPYVTADGRNIFIAGAGDNPYFNLNQNPFTSNLTRFINVANVSYDVAPWLNVAYRAGLDTYTDRRKSVFSISAQRVPLGAVQDQSIYRSEINGDLLINLKKDNLFFEGFNANLLLGQNINQRRYQSVVARSENLIFNGFPNSAVGNVFSNGTGEFSSVRRLLGYYGQLSLGYNNYLFLELTGRADQSSTLPTANNTYFYPSATASFVFSDAFKIASDIFSYGKIRANVAKVGRDADPYNLQTNYSVASYGNNVAAANFPFTVIPNGGSASVIYPGFALSNVAGGGTTLEPEFTKSFEVGTNLGFINNRVSLDLTYFKTISENQISSVATPGATGYVARVTNVGRMDNQGIEGLLNITPVRTNSFRWDISANYTRIRNKVVSIAPGVTQSVISGVDYFGGIEPSIKEGEPYGVIIGSKKTRVTDESSPYFGQYVINGTTGLFATETANQIIADPNPKWQGGLSNTFSFKGLSLSVLVDTKQGGDVFSFTNYFLKARGALKETAEIDRSLPRIIPGVIENGDGTYRPNNIQIAAQNYWGSFGSANELNVYDATVYRLREMTLSYALPKTLLEKTPFGQASISLTGRNLFYYAPNANFDPEVNTQGAGNVRGLELQGAPNTRNYGVNIRFTL